MAPHAAITSTAPATTRTTTRDPFQARYDFDSKLPAELRAEAAGMDWGLFKATYAPAATVQVALTGAEELNWCDRRYSAEVTCTSKTESPRISHCQVTATGPAAAVSDILSACGRYVEMLSFHQITLYEATVTCIKVAHQVDHTRSAWAVGFGDSPAHSVAAALSSAAQRIYSHL